MLSQGKEDNDSKNGFINVYHENYENFPEELPKVKYVEGGKRKKVKKNKIQTFKEWKLEKNQLCMDEAYIKALSVFKY